MTFARTRVLVRKSKVSFLVWEVSVAAYIIRQVLVQTNQGRV